MFDRDEIVKTSSERRGKITEFYPFVLWANYLKITDIKATFRYTMIRRILFYSFYFIYWSSFHFKRAYSRLNNFAVFHMLFMFIINIMAYIDSTFL